MSTSHIILTYIYGAFIVLDNRQKLARRSWSVFQELMGGKLKALAR